MFLSSRSNWQNHLNTSHQIIVVMWTCSAASCDFTWITTTGTKKGQKGNKENKLNLISLKRSERQSQKVFCCDPDKQEIVSMKWDVMPSSFFEDMTLSSLLRLSSRGAERHPSTLKHETWNMRHETWDRLMWRSRWSKSTLMTSDSILQGIKTQHFILHSLGKSTGSTLTWICLSV